MRVRTKSGKELTDKAYFIYCKYALYIGMLFNFLVIMTTIFNHLIAKSLNNSEGNPIKRD